MSKIRKMIIVGTFFALASGCSSNARLRSEIADIESRIATAEADITTQTADIGAVGPDLQVHLAYRPFQNWATAFSARAEADRTISFRQTGRAGDLHYVSHKCIPFPPWEAEYRNGQRVRIHESDSTRFGLTFGKLSVEPLPDGLALRTRLELDGRTQIYGWHRIPCVPAVDGNIGVPFSAQTTALLRLQVTPSDEGTAQYSLALVEPDSIGFELRADFGWFRLGRTIPVDSVARELASGKLDLMYSQAIELKMPSGETRSYLIAAINPSVSTNTKDVRFSTDFELRPPSN